MKKNKTIYLIGFSLFICGISNAQNTENQDNTLVGNQEKFIAINQLQNTSVQEVRENMAGTNSVFIRQVGVDNQIFSNVTAASSNIILNQNGERNLIDINENSIEVEKLITQNGNNNTVTDFSFNPDISTKIEILQEGDNHYFERFGSNELSKNLKFKMNGNARTIIIRSF